MLRYLPLLLLLACQPQAEAPPAKTVNVIYILADDLGYGDLGSYGQTKIRTPNLDRMAQEGMRFTQHYSGSTVCAPSRSALMTGLHTGHTYVRGNREVKPEGQHPLAAEAFTLAELMKQAGYVTGAYGKWGLGFVGSSGDPNAQGFDAYYGYNCQRQAHRYYPKHLWHNEQQILLPGNDGEHTVTYAPDLIQEQALKFIESNQDKPFFLFLPRIIPHAEVLVPDDEILASYRGAFPEDKPYAGRPGSAYGPDWNVSHYCPQDSPHQAFAAMVTRLDQYVGEILDKLDELGLAENTLVIFTSDNGPHEEGGADPAFFDSNGPLTGLKRDLYEGGIRVPMIARWPGTVIAGSESDHISAFWDVMPTLADLTDQSLSSQSDGVSFLPTLTGQGEQAQHDYLYWEFHERGGKQAIRQGPWKAVRLQVNQDPDGPLELYRLDQDLGEQHNIADQHPEKVAEMVKLMEQAHTPNADFPFGAER